MSRGSQVVTVREVLPRRPGAAVMPQPPVEATATLAHARCWCGAVLAVVVRPWETTGDVVDALLRAAGWDAARDECPPCIAERAYDDAMRAARGRGAT